MSRFITKLFLHPLFRFFFWSAATVWIILIGVSESGRIRWVYFLLAIILLGSAIEYAVKTVAYFQKDRKP